MLRSIIVRIVGFCIRRAWWSWPGLLFAAGSLDLRSQQFSVEFRHQCAAFRQRSRGGKRELAFEKAFRRFDILEAVVEAPTPELAGAATSALTHALDEDKARFQTVTNVGDSGFSLAAGFCSCLDELERTAAGLIEGEPIIQDISTDRSLRGLVAGLEDALLGLQSNRLKLDDFAGPLNMVSDSLEKVLAGKPASFSWQQLTEGEAAASLTERLGFIEINPALDFNSVEPG